MLLPKLAAINPKIISSFLVPSCIFCQKFEPHRPKIRFDMTFWSWLISKSSFQKSSASKWVLLKTWFWDKFTSEYLTRANFRAIKRCRKQTLTPVHIFFECRKLFSPKLCHIRTVSSINQQIDYINLPPPPTSLQNSTNNSHTVIWTT